MGKRKDIHERVLNASSTSELMDAYGEWAATYDSDLMGEMGYRAPDIAARALRNRLPGHDARILDAGCGTGIVGEILHRSGYRNLDGLDYSRHMLDRAREKGVYRTLTRMDLTRPLDIPGDAYDAVISVGTFTCGHVGPDALEELARIARPGGHICFTVRERAYTEDGYEAAIRGLERKGAWSLVEVEAADYILQEGARCRVCLCEVGERSA